MNKNKITYIAILNITFFLPAKKGLCQLDPNTEANGRTEMEYFALESGYDTSNSDISLGNYMGMIIEGFLSLMGIIFIILIILAGFNWMTAQGDESKVSKAKDTIARAAIGLLIVIGAYAITAFVFKALGDAAGSGASGPLTP